MRALVTGGTGVVGRAAVDALLRRGHAVRLLSRNAARDARRWPVGVEARPGDVADADSLRGAADGCDVVLHLAGIVEEEPPEATFEAVNVRGTENVVAEVNRAGVRRLVYVSSLGADRGESGYHRSKRAGEEAVRAGFGGDWVVCRPGNVYGPGDEVVSLLLKLVRTLPAIPLVGSGDRPFQPVWAEDAGEALARACEPDAPARADLDLAGAETTTLNDVLDRICRITGRNPARLPVPEALARLGVRLADRLPGARLPVTEDQLVMLEEGNVIPPGGVNALTEVLGVEPTPLDEGLLRLADAVPELLPEQGVGGLHRQRYWADVHGSRLDADALFELVCRDFCALAPEELMRVGAEPGTPCALEAGRTLTLRIPLRGHVQVRCEEVAERTATCVTLEGHPLAGTIRFAVEPLDDGAVRVEVRSFHRAADGVDHLVMTLFGRRVQRATWRAVVEEVVRRSGGEAPAGVRTESRFLDEEEAADVERWAEALVTRRRRAEAEEPGAAAG